MLVTGSSDVVCCCETWLSPNVLDCSVVSDLPFTVYRCDRTDAAYGGACIITRDSAVTAMQVNVDAKFKKLEVVAIDILNVVTPIRVITIYRSPSPDSDADAISDMKRLIKCLKQLCDVNRSVVITGDININWKDINLLADRDLCSVLFAQFANQYAFDQHVNSVTRPRPSADVYTGSVIDLVLCNDTHVIHNVEVGPPFSSSDHCVVDFELSYLPLNGGTNQCRGVTERTVVSVVAPTYFYTLIMSTWRVGLCDWNSIVQTSQVRFSRFCA